MRIVGEPYRNYSALNERGSKIYECIGAIIPSTTLYFNTWRSHQSDARNRARNLICVMGSFDMVVRKIRTISLTYKDNIPEIFFDGRYIRRAFSTEDSSVDAVEILVNNSFAGLYLPVRNVMFLTDWTHDAACAKVALELLPKLIDELGIKPLPENLRIPDLNSVPRPIVTVGCDPEFELHTGDPSDVVEANEYVSDEDGQIGADGSGDQVEIRPEPGTPIEVVRNIRNLIKKFAREYHGMDLTDIGDTFPLGGHIHLGVGGEYDPPEGLVNMLDAFIGQPMRWHSGDARDEEGYGDLGDVRYNAHGFEYRTPPSTVFQNPAIAVITMKLAKNLTERFFLPGEIVFEDDPVEQDYIRVGGLSPQQAKYFLKFCVDAKPSRSIVASWKVAKPKSEKSKMPGRVVFRDLWRAETRNIFMDVLHPLAEECGITIVMFGLGETRGERLCTVPTQETDDEETERALWSNNNRNLNIGISYDIRMQNSKATQEVVASALRREVIKIIQENAECVS